MLGLPALIKRRVYEAPNPVSEVARFEREVAEAACEGDSVALEIRVDTTLLASMTLEGMGPCIALVGSTTREVLEAYVEQILVPTLRPG